MAKKKRLLPFKAMPGSWGLSGSIYDEAEANYYYEGEELERRILDIQYREYPLERKLRHVDLDFKHGKISEYTKDLKYLEIEEEDTPVNIARVKLNHKKISEYEFDKIVIDGLELSETQKEVELLKVDFKHGKIKKNDFEKKTFTLEEKPWVGILNDNLNPELGMNGFYIELDWNEYWVDLLRANGYTGISEEHIVEQWFADVNSGLQSEETVAVIPLARQMRNRDNGTIY